jgi:hypothetical protein
MGLASKPKGNSMEMLKMDRRSRHARLRKRRVFLKRSAKEQKEYDKLERQEAEARRNTQEAIERQQADNMDDQEWQAALYGQLPN